MLCRDYGNTSIRRAYADRSPPELGRYQQSMAQNGITLIQVTRFRPQQKNAPDILMTVDAMEVLITPTSGRSCWSRETATYRTGVHIGSARVLPGLRHQSA